MKLSSFDNADVGVLIVAILAIGFGLAWPLLGFWEAVRGFAVEAALLAAAFYVARQYLPWEDAPRERVKRPAMELTLAAVGLVAFYFIWPMLLSAPDWVSRYLNILLAISSLGVFTLAAMLPYGYDLSSWGLRRPRGRDLLVLLVVAVITAGGSWLAGSLLELSEVTNMVGPARPLLYGFLQLTWESRAQIGDLFPVVIATFIVSVVGQELFFRVYLQNRLAHYIPGRWALFVQAALFYVASLAPLYLLSGGELPASFALTQIVVLSNGVLAGYFWRKTGNLWLLVLLSLLAFARWGL